MFLTLEDDGCLHVHASPEQAAVAIEALDAETCVRAAFDGRAVPYAIEWLEPNRAGRSFGALPRLENGRYRLVPRGAADATAFVLCAGSIFGRLTKVAP